MTLYADRYREIKKVGSGVTGEVHLVKDEKTGINCALKILHSPTKHMTPLEREGFRNEFLILKDLNHPSIARVFDAGLLEIGPYEEKSKHFYIVTEFVYGKDLFEYTEGSIIGASVAPSSGKTTGASPSTPSGLGKSIDIIEELFVQVLRALSYLHSKKVVHLDIKPQNMLITERESGLGNWVLSLTSPESRNPNPILKLIDFGFANFYQRRFIRSREGDPLTAGTTPYVSPEVIELDPDLKAKPDYRADLYSLGCTFYKVLTREVPFKGNSVQDIHSKHLYEVPRPPSSLKAHIPSYWDKIILRLLEKEPAKRYESAQAVIKDLIMLSGKSYPVEIPETRISYLPQKGKLVARELEFKKFIEHYENRISTAPLFGKKPYLIIKGKNGVGKTRFLEECKNYTQAHFTKTMTWKEFKNYGMAEDVPQPCLVLADNVSFTASDIEKAEVFLEGLQILIIFGTSREETPGDPNQIIELENFTKEQTREYILATLELSIPDNMLDNFYLYTQGNPSDLTDYLGNFLKNESFKDEHGSWTAQMLDDLGINFEALEIPQSIRKGIADKIAKIEALDNNALKTTCLDFIYTATVIGQPSFEDLSEITGGHVIEEALKFLVKEEIFKLDSTTHHYGFPSPAYRRYVLQTMPRELKESMHDRAADYYERTKAPKEKIYYYRGRGKRLEAATCLLELARIKKDQNLYSVAQEHLLLLARKSNTDQSLLDQGRLELGEILIETGKYDKAQICLKGLVDRGLQIWDHDPLLYAKALERLGFSFKQQNQLDTANNYYNESLQLVQPIPQLVWMEVVLKSRLARNELDRGNPEKAEKLFCEAWDTWKNKLDEEEKFLAARCNIDSIYYQKEEYQKAIRVLEEILQVVSKKPHVDIYPLVLYKLGRTYIRTGEKKKGKEFLYQSLDLMKRRQTSHLLYVVYNELGNFHFKNEEFEPALENFQHAFNLANRKAMSIHFFIVAHNMAKVHSKLGHREEAETYYQFVIRNIDHPFKQDELQANDHIFMSYLELSSIYREAEELKKSIECLEKASALLKEKDYLKKYAINLKQEQAKLADVLKVKK